MSESRFDNLFAAWNTNRRHQHDVSDDEAERLNDQEAVLLKQIIAMPALNVGEVAAKVFVAKSLIEQTGSRWSDQRDVKVLDSVLADLTRMGGDLAAG